MEGHAEAIEWVVSMTETSVAEVKLKAQMKRFAGFAGFENYKDELLRVAKRDAKSEDHIERIVTSIVDTRRPNEGGFTACPTPAELSDALRSVDDSGRFQPARKDCTDCGGTSYRIRWAQRNGEMVEGAERCPCSIRGKA